MLTIATLQDNSRDEVRRLYNSLADTGLSGVWAVVDPDFFGGLPQNMQIQATILASPIHIVSVKLTEDVVITADKSITLRFLGHHNPRIRNPQVCFPPKFWTGKFLVATEPLKHSIAFGQLAINELQLFAPNHPWIAAGNGRIAPGSSRASRSEREKRAVERRQAKAENEREKAEAGMNQSGPSYYGAAQQSSRPTVAADTSSYVGEYDMGIYPRAGDPYKQPREQPGYYVGTDGRVSQLNWQDPGWSALGQVQQCSRVSVQAHAFYYVGTDTRLHLRSGDLWRQPDESPQYFVGLDFQIYQVLR
jgi:hypothetical protein